MDGHASKLFESLFKIWVPPYSPPIPRCLPCRSPEKSSLLCRSFYLSNLLGLGLGMSLGNVPGLGLCMTIP